MKTNGQKPVAYEPIKAMDYDEARHAPPTEIGNKHLARRLRELADTFPPGRNVDLLTEAARRVEKHP